MKAAICIVALMCLASAQKPPGDTLTPKGCLFNGVWYKVGDQFMDGPCIVCTCRKVNEITCSRISCPPLKGCERILTAVGECCPICDDPLP